MIEPFFIESTHFGDFSPVMKITELNSILIENEWFSQVIDLFQSKFFDRLSIFNEFTPSEKIQSFKANILS